MSQLGRVDWDDMADEWGPMDCRELKKRLRAGEGMSTEFKRCGGQPGEGVFETIRSFANRQGGDLFLGVSDDGSLLVIPQKAVMGI